MADIDGLDEFLNYLNRVASNVDNIIDESLEETSITVTADTKLNTPVTTGALKRSWTHGEVKTNGTNKSIEIGSNLNYAQPVEEGHKQGSTFVQGKFMLKKSILKNEDNLQKTLDRKLSELR